MIVTGIYFSGTGNSYRIIDTCRSVFVQNNCAVTLSSVVDSPDIRRKTDWVGFCFPVYAFGIPRICRQYLSDLPRFSKPVKAFVLITAGDAQEAGLSVRQATRILKRKGADVRYSRVIQMPANWTVAMNPPSEKEACTMIDAGVEHARKAAKQILSGVVRRHPFNYPPGYTPLRFYKDFYLFKWLGLGNYWREFRVDETCDGCGLCERLCPTGSIRKSGDRPEWSKTCEQCMRCVNYCPRQAIYQKSGGSIKGRNTYVEPTFRPLKLKKSQDRSS